MMVKRRTRSATPIASGEHGTGTWSVLGGYKPFVQIGPAYNARFVLAKTEDVRSRDTDRGGQLGRRGRWGGLPRRGGDLLLPSPTSTFDGTANDYTYTDLDGYTTVVALGAVMAARRASWSATPWATRVVFRAPSGLPADADSIISVGAVDSGK
jgi:hypothetical protein